MMVAGGGGALSAMIRRLQAYLLRGRQHIVVKDIGR